MTNHIRHIVVIKTHKVGDHKNQIELVFERFLFLRVHMIHWLHRWCHINEVCIWTKNITRQWILSFIAGSCYSVTTWWCIYIFMIILPHLWATTMHDIQYPVKRYCYIKGQLILAHLVTIKRYLYTSVSFVIGRLTFNTFQDQGIECHEKRGNNSQTMKNF